MPGWTMFLMMFLACVTEKSFPTQVTNLYCSREQECDKASFEDTYSSVTDCKDTQGKYASDLNDCYIDHCDFDAKGAADAIKSVREADCGDLDEALGDLANAYDCDNMDVDLAACIAGVYY